MKLENKKRYLIILIVVIITIISLGTYAWLTYRTNDTAMVLTIGDINNVRITMSPYQIDTKLSPNLTYTGEPYTTVEVINNSSYSSKINLYYQINKIGTELRNSNFRYTIEKSTNGSSFTSYQTGNFNGKTDDSVLNILDEIIPSTTTYYYRVYLWLYGSGSSQNNLQGNRFNGELRGDISNTNKLGETTEVLTRLQSEVYNMHDGVYYFDNNGYLDYGDNSPKVNLNLTNNNVPSGVVSIWNNNIIYLCTKYDNYNYEYNLRTGVINERNMPCLTDRYQNSVVNGDLSYESNLNFPNFGTYSNGALQLTTSAKPQPVTTDIIPVDTNKTYRISVDLKSSDANATYYVGYRMYDENRNEIAPSQVMYLPNTLTWLTEDLKPNDTVVYLNNLSNWRDTGTGGNYQRGFIIWNYVDKTGYQYPELTYSRNIFYNLYSDIGVDTSGITKSNNTISLSSAWPSSRGTIPKGTKISQSNSGSTFNYAVMSNRKITTQWATYNATVSGVNTSHTIDNYKFRAGTKYIAFSVIYNYSGLSNVTTYMRNVSITEVQP